MCPYVCGVLPAPPGRNFREAGGMLTVWTGNSSGSGTASVERSRRVWWSCGGLLRGGRGGVRGGRGEVLAGRRRTGAAGRRSSAVAHQRGRGECECAAGCAGQVGEAERGGGGRPGGIARCRRAARRPERTRRGERSTALRQAPRCAARPGPSAAAGAPRRRPPPTRARRAAEWCACPARSAAPGPRQARHRTAPGTVPGARRPRREASPRRATRAPPQRSSRRRNSARPRSGQRRARCPATAPLACPGAAGRGKRICRRAGQGRWAPAAHPAGPGRQWSAVPPSRSPPADSRCPVRGACGSGGRPGRAAAGGGGRTDLRRRALCGLRLCRCVG